MSVPNVFGVVEDSPEAARPNVFGVTEPTAKKPNAFGIVEDEPSPTPGPSPVRGIAPPAAIAKPSSVIRRAVADPLLDVASGLIAVPKSFVGLGSIATGGRIGRGVDTVMDKTGLSTLSEAGKFWQDLKSPEAKEAQRRVSEADGFTGKIAAAVRNPSTIGSAVIQSVPGMLAGGGIARVATKLIPKLAPIAMGLGEGAIGAGASAENIRESSPDKLLSFKQSALSAVSGVGTAALGVMGGKLAAKLKIVDPDTWAAGMATPETALPLWKRVIGGAVSEGLFEELPQSVQEQMFQNEAMGRPIMEGVAESAAMGTLAGVAMGGGANIASRGRVQDPVQSTTPAAPQTPPAAAPVPTPAPAPVAPVQEQATPPAGVQEDTAPAYDVQAAQLRYPDVTAQVNDWRFDMYTKAGYPRDQAIEMVKADQSEEVGQPITSPDGSQRVTLGGQPDPAQVAQTVLQSAGVQNVTPAAQAVVAEQIKAGQPVDAQIIADSTGSEVDVGKLNDHLKLAELGYTGLEIAYLEAEPGLAQLKDIITNNRSRQSPPPVAAPPVASPVPVVIQGSKVAAQGTGSISPPKPAANQSQPSADTGTAAEAAAGETTSKVAQAKAKVKASLAKREGESPAETVTIGFNDRRFNSKSNAEIFLKTRKDMAGYVPVESADGRWMLTRTIPKAQFEAEEKQTEGEKAEPVSLPDIADQMHDAYLRGTAADFNAKLNEYVKGGTMTREQAFSIAEAVRYGRWVNPFVPPAPVESKPAKASWEMTRAEAVSKGIDELVAGGMSREDAVDLGTKGFEDDHRKEVNAAIGRKEPVPASVLADYPELAPKPLTGAEKLREKVNPPKSTPGSPESTVDTAPLADQLNAGTAVKPRDATFVRVNGTQVVPIADVDTLKGAGPFKSAEWGTKGKSGFVPMGGKLAGVKAKLKKSIPVEAAATQVEKPSTAVEGPQDGWRENIIKARMYAVSLGMSGPVMPGQVSGSNPISRDTWTNLGMLVDAIDARLRGIELDKRLEEGANEANAEDAARTTTDRNGETLNVGDRVYLMSGLGAEIAGVNADGTVSLNGVQMEASERRNYDAKKLQKRLAPAGTASAFVAGGRGAVLPNAAPRPEVKSPAANLSDADAARLKEIQARLRKKIMGQTNMGFDPEILTLSGEMATLYAKGGIKTFKQFAGSVKADMADMWEQMKSYLHSAWQAAGAVDESLDDVSRADAKIAIDEIDAQRDNVGGGNGDESDTQTGDNQPPSGRVNQPGNERRLGVGSIKSEPGQGMGGAGDASGEGSGGTGEGSGIGGAGSRGRTDASGSTRDVRTVRGAESQALIASSSFDPSPEERQYLEKRGDKQRFRDAISAIELIHLLETEDRSPTISEQAVLFRYPGWGGLKAAFGDTNKAWTREYDQLRKLVDDGIITEDEYSAMRASIQDAHYTSPAVIEHGLHGALTRFGFGGGKMFEAGSGIGLINLLIPDAWKANNSYVGLERDPLTAKIAARLLPTSDIHTASFEKSSFTRSSFDAVAGNPPFGSKSLYFKNNKKINKFSIHNQFIAEQLELLRPGGVGAFIVSRYFMDAKDPSARLYIASKAQFLGAIRLPNTAFKGNANTEVTTDIVFFQRLVDSPENVERAKSEPSHWTKTDEFMDAGGTVTINRWMKYHPEMMLGIPSTQGKMQAGEVELTLNPKPDQNLADDIDTAVAMLPEGVYRQGDMMDSQRIGSPVDVSSDLPEGVKVGTYFVAGTTGTVMRRTQDVDMKPRAEVVQFKNATAEKRARGIIEVRNAMNRLVAAEMDDNYTDSGLKKLRKELNSIYDSFKKEFGFLNDSANRQAYRDSDDIWRVFALERDFDPGLSPKTKAVMVNGEAPRAASARKADIFDHRVNAPYREITHVNTSMEALAASLNQRGSVDLKHMADLSGKTQEQLLSDLKGMIFNVPLAGWQAKDKALTGNVREKANLAAAELEANPDREDIRDYYEAVKEVIPKDINVVDIYAPIGAPWVAANDYSDFSEALSGVRPNTVLFNKANGGWYFNHNDSGTGSVQTWGTARLPFGKIMELLMNRKPIIVYDVFTDINGKERKELNQEQTELANQKAEEIKQRFSDWLWSDEGRRNRLHRAYNDSYNNYVEPRYDGSHLSLPGASSAINLRPHQKNVVWRTISDLKVLYDHVVGAGKTMAGIASFMEMKRMGRIRKPLFVVPNHLVRQWRDEFVKLYPNANILAAEPQDFEKKNRAKMFGKILTGEFDAIIVGHSSFKKIGVSPETEREFLEEQRLIIEEAIREAEAAARLEGRKKRNRSQSQLEAMRDKIKSKMDALADRTGDKDTVATFEELGIDGLFVDEYHELGKNLFYTTQMQNVAGLGSPQGSGKAFDLYMKTRYLSKHFGGKAPIVFATGTPISNSMVEMFTLQRYIQAEELDRMGLRTLDAWVSVFGRIEPVYEVDPSGTRFRLSTRFREFGNVGDLAMMYRTNADVVTSEDLQEQAQARGERFPTPKVKGGKPEVIGVPRSALQSEYFGVEQPVLDSEGNQTYDSDGNPVMEYPAGTILFRTGNLRNVDPTEDNMLKITNDARKAGLDYRLIDPTAADDPGSKVNRAVKEIAAIYGKWDKESGTQLVFCDLSVPGSAREKIAQTVYYRGSNGDIVEGKGRAVSLDNAPEWAEIYAIERKGASAADSGWIIIERNTGINLADDHKRAEAVKEAAAASTPEFWADNEYKHQRMGDLTLEEIEAWREQQGDESTADDSDVTMDELLAADSPFSVYDDVREKLVKSGIPANRIAFIHDYDTPTKKQKLFDAMNRGDIRILMGSTPKMGAGMNVQKRLVALHHLDAPWRPSDLEQREGRIIRQGNMFYERQMEKYTNPQDYDKDPDAFAVEIKRYGTEMTYDARMWQIIEHKAIGIVGFRRADRSTRTLDDVGGEAANAADMKAAVSGDPRIQKEIELRNTLSKLQALKRAYTRNRFELEGRRTYLQGSDQRMQSDLQATEKLIKIRDDNPQPKDEFSFRLSDGTTTDKKGDVSEVVVSGIKKGNFSGAVGRYRGFAISWSRVLETLVIRANDETVTLYSKEDRMDGVGLIKRIDNWLEKLTDRIAMAKASYSKDISELAEVNKELEKSFSKADELANVGLEHEAVKRELMSSRTKRQTPRQPQSQAARGESIQGAGLSPADFQSTLTAETAAVPFAAENVTSGRYDDDTADGAFWRMLAENGDGQAARGVDWFAGMPETRISDAQNSAWLTPDGRIVGDRQDHEVTASNALAKNRIAASDSVRETIQEFQRQSKAIRLSWYDNEVGFDILGIPTQAQIDMMHRLSRMAGRSTWDIDTSGKGDDYASGAGFDEFMERFAPRFMRSRNGQVRAITYGNRSHFFTDRYDNLSQLRGDIREEAGHRLVNELGGEAWRKIGMLTYRGRWTAIRDEIKRNYKDRKGNPLADGTPEFNHELIAKAFRDGKQQVGLLTRFLDAVVSAFRALARRLGFDVALSDAEVRNALRGMLEAKAMGMRGSGATTPGVLYADNATITRPGGPSAQFMVEAYHGTPHTFEPEPDAPFGRVKKEKVGSGEGAAAYGWGVLYTAQSKAVADEYKKNLSQSRPFSLLINGKSWSPSTPEEYGAFERLRDEWNPRELSTTRGALNRAIRRAGRNIRQSNDPDYQKRTGKELGILQAWMDTAQINQGSLYHVELNLDPEDCLDWDKPLSKQSPDVQQRLFMDFGAMQGFNADPTGEQMYRLLSQMKSAEAMAQGDNHLIPGEVQDKRAASEYLASLGIKGIRYADQGSRSDQYGVSRIWANEKYPSRPQWQVSAPNGYNESFTTEAEARADANERNAQKTYNYVVFNESDIRVVGRNGETLKPTEAMRDVQAAQSFRNPAVTPEQDARYLELAKDPEKNAAELQRMVDEAAKTAWYTVGPVWHGGDVSPNRFEGRNGVTWFSTSKGKRGAGKFGQTFTEAVLRSQKTLDLTDAVTGIPGKGHTFAEWMDIFKGHGVDTSRFEYDNDLLYKEGKDDGIFYWSFLDSDKGIVGSDNNIANELRRQGFDAIHSEEDGVETWAVLDPSQIKSADPITRDDQGRVIPLSERFNDASPDIRFARSETKQGDEDEWRKYADENREQFNRLVGSEEGLPLDPKTGRPGRVEPTADVVVGTPTIARAIKTLAGIGRLLVPVRGLAARGMTDAGIIPVFVSSEQSPDAMDETVRHEVFHALRQARHASATSMIASVDMRSQGYKAASLQWKIDYEHRLKAIEQWAVRYVGARSLETATSDQFKRISMIIEDYIREELVADYVGSGANGEIFGDRKAVQDVAGEIFPIRRYQDMTPAERAFAAGAQGGQSIQAEADKAKFKSKTDAMKARMKANLEKAITEARAKGAEKALDQKAQIGEMLREYDGGEAAQKIAEGRMSLRAAVNRLVKAKAGETAALRREIIAKAKESIPDATVKRSLSPHFLAVLLGKSVTDERFNKALQQIDAEAKKIQKHSLIMAIRSIYQKSAESMGVNVLYRQRIKSLMEGVLMTKPSESTLEKARELADFLDAEKNAGSEMDLTLNKHMAKLLRTLTGTPLRDMDVPQLEDIFIQIHGLANIGRVYQQGKNVWYKGMQESDMASVEQSTPIESHMRIESDPFSDTKLTIPERFRNLMGATSDAMKRWYIYHQPMDVVFDLLDGAKHYMGANYRLFKARIDNAYSAFRSAMHPFETELADKIKSLGLDEKAAARIQAYAYDQQDTGREKLLNTFSDGTEAGDAKINAMLDAIKLTDNEMAFYTWAREKIEANRGAIEKVMNDVYNTELVPVKNYWPMLTDWNRTEKTANVFGLEMDEQGNFVKTPEPTGGLKKNVSASFTVRRKGAGEQILKMNAFHNLHKHIQDVNYYIHVGPTVKYLQELANKPEYRAAVGDMGQQIVREYLDTMARQGGMNGSHILRWVDTLRSNIGIGTLGFRLSSILIQPSSFFDGAGMIGGRWAFKGALNSAQKEWHTFIVDNMTEIKDRVGGEWALGEAELKSQIAKYGFWPLKMFDQLTAISIASGAYEKNLHERGIPLDFNNPDKTAIEYAQLVVGRTQTRSDYKDQPLSVTRGALFGGSRTLARAIYQFQSFSLNKFSYLMHDGLYSAIKNKEPNKAAAILTWTMAAFMFEEGIRYMIRGMPGGGGNDDDDAEDYWKRVFENYVQLIPWFGSVVSALQYNRFPAPVVSTITEAFAGGKSMITGKTAEAKYRGAARLGGSAGSMAGIPGTSQAAQWIKNSIRTDSEDIHNAIINDAKRLHHRAAPRELRDKAMSLRSDLMRKGLIDPKKVSPSQFALRYKLAFKRLNP